MRTLGGYVPFTLDVEKFLVDSMQDYSCCQCLMLFTLILILNVTQKKNNEHILTRMWLNDIKTFSFCKHSLAYPSFAVEA